MCEEIVLYGKYNHLFLSIDSLSYLQLLDIIVYQCTSFIYHYITGPSWMQSDGLRYRRCNARKI